MRPAYAGAIGLLLLAACGDDDGGGDQAARTTTTSSTTEPPVEDVEVRVTAEVVFSGCSQALGRAGVDIENGQRIALEDGLGAVLGVGTPQLTPSADACDWSTTIDQVDVTADFYTVVAGPELITVSGSELEANDWTIEAHIDVTGLIR